MLKRLYHSHFLQDNLSTIPTNTIHAFHTLFHYYTTTNITIITTTNIVNAITITTSTTITTNLHVSTYRKIRLVHTKIHSITTTHSGTVAKISLHVV